MRKKNTKYILILILILISFIPLRAFFHEGIPKTHDIEIHLARYANFNKSFLEDNLFPRWGAYLNKGFGHPTLMFLYPLPNYLSLFTSLLGFSLISGAKILFILGYVLSGLFMFLFLSELFNHSSGFLGTILYLFSPYRFVDIYVRGALPEHLFFTFAPLSLFLFLKYYQNPTRLKLILVSISLAILILVHNACSVLFFPFTFALFLLIFRITLKKRNRLKLFLTLCLPFIISVILAFFYWYPALVEGKYTLRNLIINKEFTVTQLASLQKLLIPNWGYQDPRFENGLSLQLGLINTFIIVLLILFHLFKKIKLSKLAIYLMIVIFLSIYLMTDFSKFIWQSNSIMYLIHFPWRLLVIIVFAVSILGPAGIDTLKISNRFNNRYKILIILMISLASIALTFNYQRPASYFNQTDSYFLNEYGGTADNGESSPIWSTLAIEEKAKQPINIIEGQAVITNIDKRSEKHTYNISVISDRVRIVDNTLYFPGWSFYDNGKNLTSQVEYQDPNYRGLITFWLDQGNHNISLVFQETKVRHLSLLISSMGLLLFILPIGKLIFPETKLKKEDYEN